MRHAWRNEKCTISSSGNVEKEYLEVGGAIMLECVGEVQYECILWIPGIQDKVKWWAFVNMVIKSSFIGVAED